MDRPFCTDKQRRNEFYAGEWPQSLGEEAIDLLEDFAMNMQASWPSRPGGNCQWSISVELDP
jgi:hypothetical protein